MGGSGAGPEGGQTRRPPRLSHLLPVYTRTRHPGTPAQGSVSTLEDVCVYSKCTMGMFFFSVFYIKCLTSCFKELFLLCICKKQENVALL